MRRKKLLKMFWVIIMIVIHLYSCTVVIELLLVTLQRTFHLYSQLRLSTVCIKWSKDVILSLFTRLTGSFDITLFSGCSCNIFYLCPNWKWADSQQGICGFVTVQHLEISYNHVSKCDRQYDTGQYNCYCHVSIKRRSGLDNGLFIPSTITNANATTNAAFELDCV